MIGNCSNYQQPTTVTPPGGSVDILANFNSYNAIYGSIGAVIILMVWLYLSVWAVLLGGAINAELDASMRFGSARR